MDLFLKYKNKKIHVGKFVQDKCFLILEAKFKIVHFFYIKENNLDEIVRNGSEVPIVFLNPVFGHLLVVYCSRCK